MARSWSGLSSARTWDRKIKGAHGAGDAGNTVGAEGPRFTGNAGEVGAGGSPEAQSTTTAARSADRCCAPRNRANEKEASCCALGLKTQEPPRSYLLSAVPRDACAGGCASPPPQQLHSLEGAHPATVLPRAHPLQVRMSSEAGGACQDAQELTAVGAATEPPRAHCGHEGAHGRVPQDPDAAEPAALAAVGDCTPGGRSMPSHAAVGHFGAQHSVPLEGDCVEPAALAVREECTPTGRRVCLPTVQGTLGAPNGVAQEQGAEGPAAAPAAQGDWATPMRGLDPGSGSAAACGAPGSAATGLDPSAVLAAVSIAPGSVATPRRTRRAWQAVSTLLEQVMPAAAEQAELGSGQEPCIPGLGALLEQVAPCEQAPAERLGLKVGMLDPCLSGSGGPLDQAAPGEQVLATAPVKQPQLRCMQAVQSSPAGSTLQGKVSMHTLSNPSFNQKSCRLPDTPGRTRPMLRRGQPGLCHAVEGERGEADLRDPAEMGLERGGPGVGHAAKLAGGQEAPSGENRAEVAGGQGEPGGANMDEEAGGQGPPGVGESAKVAGERRASGGSNAAEVAKTRGQPRLRKRPRVASGEAASATNPAQAPAFASGAARVGLPTPRRPSWGLPSSACPKGRPNDPVVNSRSSEAGVPAKRSRQGTVAAQAMACTAAAVGSVDGGHSRGRDGVAVEVAPGRRERSDPPTGAPEGGLGSGSIGNGVRQLRGRTGDGAVKPWWVV